MSSETPARHVRMEAASDAACRRFWTGFVVAMLTMVSLKLLTWSWEPYGYIAAVVYGVIGGLVNRSRLRPLLWIFAIGALTLIYVAAYTDVFVEPCNALVRRDALQPADAVVALSGGVTADGKLDAMGLQRTLDAMELVRQGWAPVLARTIPNPRNTAEEDVRYLAELFDDVPVEAVGPAANTRGEAVAVAGLAAQRGWSRIILVTSPVHSVRAAACFEKLGFTVISSPCWERDYSLPRPRHHIDRLTVFRRWMYELMGWQMYRLRGWV